MVDLRLDTSDWKQFSEDHYVSLRIGEVQRLSKISASRTYKFPASAVGTRRHAKLEIFKRVGSRAVCIEPKPGNETAQACIQFEDTELNFNVAVSSADGDESGPTKGEDKCAPHPAKSSKVTAAKEYMERHHLELRLAEAMQALLKELPDDPAAFVAERLAKNAGMVATQSTSSKASARAAPAVAPAERTFASYYSQHFTACSLTGLYGKFAKQQLQSAAAVKLAPKAARPFAQYYCEHFREPGGEHLAGLHARFPNSRPAVQPSAAAAGTTPQRAAPQQATFREYYSAHLLPSFSGLDCLHGKFKVPIHEAAGPALRGDTAQVPTPPGREAGFCLMPSVGSWITRRSATTQQVQL
mmetsp:Transcript_23209/g.66934  ORF Transcript_23209/g.66934 Transcript_23209/m.66934 type:complete len:356 (-) Transcript_23209:298-1365(-)